MKKIRKSRTSEEKKNYIAKHSIISQFVLENPIEFVRTHKKKWRPYSRKKLDQNVYNKKGYH